jgi:hypothetical protein
LQRQSLTTARYVSGLFVLAEMSFDGRGSSAISARTSGCDDAAGSRRDNLLRLVRSNFRYRIAAPAKKVSNKTGRKKFFLPFFFARSEQRAKLLSRNGCDNILGSDPPHSRPKYVSRNVQKSNTRSRQAAKGVTR